MKTLVMTLSLILASTAVLAEETDSDRSDRRAHIQQELNLSEEQKEQMREIRNRGGSREEIREILTEEQQVKAKKMREGHEGNREQRIARMQKHLDLSDEQVVKMHQILEEGGSREEIQAVLTDEQRTKLKAERGKHKSKNKTEKQSG
ncbi:MAG: hypothetical protein V7746_23175 [Halioglobus sp.]